MQLGDLHPPRGTRRPGKRLGQGVGSGTGKTAGKGHKGQRSRSGAKRGTRTGFEGGQMPLHRRLPKIGFTNHRFRTVYQVINVGEIEALGLEGTLGPHELKASGLIRKASEPVKVLGAGELTRKVSIRAHAFSQSARDKIVQTGGEAELLG